MSAYVVSMDRLFGLANEAIDKGEKLEDKTIPNLTPDLMIKLNKDSETPKKKKKKKEKSPEELEAKAIKKQEKERQRQLQLAAEAEEERIKAEAKRQRKKKEAEVEVIQLIARKNFLNEKVEDFDPGKEKDARKIAAINIELKEIEERIEYLQREYSIVIDTVDSGSRIGRFMRRIKEKGKKVIKKVKKFFRENKELVIGLALIIVPFIARFFI